MRKIPVISLCLAAACSSSNSPPSPAPAPETRPIAVGGDMRMAGSAIEAVKSTVPYPGARVFEALTQVYDTLGIALTTLDFKGHLIGNQGMQIRQKLGKVALSKYIDCGKSQLVPSADTYEIWLSVVSHVGMETPQALESTLTTTVAAKARPLEHAQEYFDCKSTGVLEAKIVELVGKMVR